jgi:hypothetical protein
MYMPRYLIHPHTRITSFDNCQLANGADELAMRCSAPFMYYMRVVTASDF